MAAVLFAGQRLPECFFIDVTNIVRPTFLYIWSVIARSVNDEAISG